MSPLLGDAKAGLGDPDDFLNPHLNQGIGA
jgi:hypothetical protein